jgi:hypothetical protein
MKKLLNFILVSREEIKNKWWHRLVLVLLSASVVILFIAMAISTFEDNNHTWFTNSPKIFSLENNYENVDGKEIPCEESLDFDTAQTGKDIEVIIQCKGVEIPYSESVRYAKLYDVAENKLREKDGVKELDDKFTQECKDEISLQTFPTTYTGGLTPTQLAEFKCSELKEKTDPAYINLNQKYKDDIDGIAKVKVNKVFHFGIFLSDIFFWFFIPFISVLAWIIFWNSIVYRSILYIVYGKQK